MIEQRSLALIRSSLGRPEPTLPAQFTRSAMSKLAVPLNFRPPGRRRSAKTAFQQQKLIRFHQNAIRAHVHCRLAADIRTYARGVFKVLAGFRLFPLMAVRHTPIEIGLPVAFLSEIAFVKSFIALS